MAYKNNCFLLIAGRAIIIITARRGINASTRYHDADTCRM